MYDARGAEELVGEETPGEVALPLKVFEPSKNASPLGLKMDDLWLMYHLSMRLCREYTFL